MSQLVQVAGSLLVPVPFVPVQLGRLRSGGAIFLLRSAILLLRSAIGSSTLAADATVPRQPGFRCWAGSGRWSPGPGW